MLTVSFDEKAFKCKFGYCIGKAADLDDPTLWAKAQEYKRRLSGAMKAISAQDAFRIPQVKGYYATRKYDGEFAIVVFDGEHIISVNPGGTARAGLPCLDEAGALLKKAGVKSCVLGAEYYVKEGATGGHPVQQVVGILRNPKSKDQLDKLGLAVFDIVEHEGKAVSSAPKAFDLLKKWFAKGKTAHLVEHKVVDSVAAVMELFTDWAIGQGAEGVVVRNDKIGWYKIKTRHNLDVAIVGFSEGTDQRKDMLHDLLVAVVRTDGTYQELTRVGGGFSDDERRSFVKDLRRRIVPSEYVAVNNDYVAYEMIEPGPVIEISCLDMIAERARGGPVNRMVLNWTGEKYEAMSRMPLVSVISPQYIRERDDKEAGAEDTSIRQISSLAAVPDAEKSADSDEKKPSELLERRVYTKIMRDNLMVRKLLIWKTNKEDSPDFPAYVVYLTDFSPNRKNPLERDIKVSNSKTVAYRLFEEMATANFIGGWEKAK